MKKFGWPNASPPPFPKEEQITIFTMNTEPAITIINAFDNDANQALVELKEVMIIDYTLYII